MLGPMKWMSLRTLSSNMLDLSEAITNKQPVGIDHKKTTYQS